MVRLDLMPRQEAAALPLGLRPGIDIGSEAGRHNGITDPLPLKP
jgi:hypothetical protein